MSDVLLSFVYRDLVDYLYIPLPRKVRRAWRAVSRAAERMGKAIRNLRGRNAGEDTASFRSYYPLEEYTVYEFVNKEGH